MSALTSQCDSLVTNASAGVAPALRAVDCLAGETTADAFARLFGAGGALAPALTLVLTLYIAFFALSLLAGRSRLSIPALTPRMLTLGLVLTFATSWVAYSQVVWNLAVGAPDQLASLLMGAKGSATHIFADRIDIVLGAISDISQATSGGQDAGHAAAQGAASSSFGPADIMWLGALLLLLGTVGVLVTARIALAVLLALGPVFIVLALFAPTRGLTAGWLRGVVLTGVTPLFVVTGGSITLKLLVPVIGGLGGLDGIDAHAALALFLIAAVHVALMAMGLKVAWAIVSGWQVFGLAEGSGAQAVPAPMPSPAAAFPSLTAGAAAVPAWRGSGTVPVLAGSGENVSVPGFASAYPRRSVMTQVGAPASSSSLAVSVRSRARGLGSRFRTPSRRARQMPR